MQKILTYLTILSAIALPVVSVLWMRSYRVSDRIVRAGGGQVVVVNSSNGEVSLWVGPTDPALSGFEHRRPMRGVRASLVFDRVPSEVHFDVLGLAYADIERIPFRSVISTGPARGLVVPVWMVALLCGLLPLRLLIRNTQSSAEWTRQREAEQRTREATAPDAADEPPLPDFSASLPHRPVRTAAAAMRRWR